MIAILATLLIAPPATPQPPPAEVLTLDIAAPMIDVTIAGVALRLRVDLDQKDAIELNPAVAARLPIAGSRAYEASVGRITVPGRIGTAEVAIGGMSRTLPVASHDLPCCVDSDGVVGPALLPYAAVRFVRAGAAPGRIVRRSFPLGRTDAGGAFIRLDTDEGRLMIQFSLRHRGTLATASSAAILARLYRGRFEGAPFPSIRAFGVARPARAMRFDRPARLAGFAIDRIDVRIADFRGGFALPSDAAQPGEIAVRGRTPPPQHAWPAIIIGREYLDHCSEIMVRRTPPAIELACDFAAPAAR